MRVIVLGGTRFIGRAIAEALLAAGHAVLVVHRGISEPSDLYCAEHLHAERDAWRGHGAVLAAFGADAAVDVSAANGADARAALAALPPGIALVALSSIDVYRAYEALHGGMQTDPVPLTEKSPLRTARHIDGSNWENLDVEEAYLGAGATILRLGAVYGEHDYQRRFEPVLRRVRAGRDRMPVGAGGFLGSRVYAGDVARAVLAALGTRQSAGQCLNIVEDQAAPMRLFYEQVISAADARLELVRVPDEALPLDLQETGTLSQHLLVSPIKARDVLGWRATASPQVLRRAVAWHLSHPPGAPDTDFSADDAALAAAS
ncbi:MAG TPA: NAD-dependent epimerase/dehydratase family protein [Streptosporangiaceae bacterium]|nr:NAD-dependent epimerase/dehydratase family protein [Streptosporangiaceae bacterium]